MKIFNILFWIIIFVQIIFGFWNLFKTILFDRKSEKYLNKEINHEELNKNELYIVIPCSREKDIICSTIDHFLSIKKNYKNIKIIIVTSEKEEYEKEKSLIK